MIKVFQRVRKSSEKAAFSQATTAKIHKKSMKVKLNVEDRKPVLISKLVISKKSSKNKVKNKASAVFSIEVSFDNEKNKNKKKKKKKKKNDEEKEDDENNKNNENVEKINVSLIIKRLFDQKDCKIINFKRRVSDVKENHVDISNIQSFEKDEIISFANKKDVNEIFTLITKTYIFVWMIYFDNVQFDEDNDSSHIIINVQKLKFETFRF